MTIWLTRAGSHGEFEHRFLSESRVYLTWDGLDVNLSNFASKADLQHAIAERYSSSKGNTIRNWASQIWPFAHEMKVGDLVILPLKTQPAIYIGEITGEYQFDTAAEDPFFHWHSVKWIGEAIPRDRFGKDLLFSFGAFMTICRIQRNNAEKRINAMRLNGWKAESFIPATVKNLTDEIIDFDNLADIEEQARDRIAQLIISRFKGHGLARLVDEILKAQGYTTFRSEEGPDGGIDILAGSGALGFGEVKLCVQVKSQDTPVDSKTLNELKGVMTNVSANQGLLVAWGGYKGSVQKLISSNFFSVRLWTQKELLEALFDHYDALEEEIKAEIPLKRIWVVAAQESD